MPDSQDRRIGPDWLWYIGREVHRLRNLGQDLDVVTYKGLYFWAICLEIDDIPRPVVKILDRRTAQLFWGNGRKKLTMECRGRYFTIDSTNEGHSTRGQFKRLDWIEPSRRAMRWMFPDEAGGSPVGILFKEIEI